MEQAIFTHMEKIRNLTLKVFDRIPEEVMDIIPTGFNNSIRWNLGHIAYIQDRHVYTAAEEPIVLPDSFEQYFKMGTKPADWVGTPPSLTEIKDVLAAQPARIKQAREGRLHEALPKPYTNLLGVTFHTKGELLLFNFYHEAMHMEAIKYIYRAIQREQEEAQ